MFITSLDTNVLQCFTIFITLYLGRAPELVEIKEYIELLCKEKGIIESYNNNLVTQDEFCAFLLAHIYTKFVLNAKDVRDVSDDEIKNIRNRIKALLFS